MLPRIKQLSDELITKIAAGEVIERPASLLKELVENSLDAQASHVSIEIEGAGRNRIAVSDNGIGMTPEEARLSLRRHATSKISELNDLNSILTFGFRGEALPSIASVSRFRMKSRSDTNESGWEIQVDGGQTVKEGPVPREQGTTIEVRDLFYNTPARYKFLKTDSTERSQCVRVFEELVFSAPEVSFHLTLEKGKPLVFTGQSSESVEDELRHLKRRVTQAWGARFPAESFYPVSSQTPHFALKGLISTPHHSQSTMRHQILFINGRPVHNRKLNRAVYQAFTGQLPIQRHPAWVLFLQVDPNAVDVNVHPTKREVKLTHETELFGFVLDSIRKTLVGGIPAEPKSLVGAVSQSVPPSSKPLQQSLDKLYRPIDLKGINVGSFWSPDKEIEKAANQSFKDQKLTAIYQINKMFILAQTESAFWMVDQHAAAERVLYEGLQKNMDAQKAEIQMLLVPFTWEVSMSLYPALQSKLSFFQAMGFVIEDFGDKTYLIKGYPSVLGNKFDLSSLLDGMSDVFGDPKVTSRPSTADFGHRLAALAACKGSVKAGDNLDIKECQAVLDQIVQCDQPLTCPHGRPTFLKFTFDELEHKFHRK